MKKIIYILLLTYVSISYGQCVDIKSCNTEGKKSFDARHYDDAYRFYEFSARKGDVIAQFQIGKMIYLKKISVGVDYLQALKWFEKALANGNSEAGVYAAIIYSNGTGVEKNEKKAYEMYLKAAEYKNPIAYEQLGVMFREGTVATPQNYQTSKQYFEKASLAGNAYGSIGLGIYYYYGVTGIEKNAEKAKFYYEKAISQDEEASPGAKNNLAGMYWTGTDATPQSFSTAIRLYKEAIAKGYNGSLINLADLYMEIREYQNAVTFYEKSIAAGNDEAMVILGHLYMEGSGEIVKDSFEAKKYFDMAFLKRNSDAMNFLGVMYEIGTAATVTDLKKAISYFEQAVAMNNSTAMINLANMYYFGTSATPINMEKAKKLIQNSCNLKNEEGCAILRNFGNYIKK